MNKVLPVKVFILSHLLILLVGLGLILGLAYYLNKDFPKLDLNSYNPVTREPTSFNLELNTQDDLLVYDKSIIISGQTSPQATVIISQATADIGLEANQKGEFSRVVSLTPGLNNIIVSVFDQNGNLKQETRTVFYSEEKI